MYLPLLVSFDLCNPSDSTVVGFDQPHRPRHPRSLPAFDPYGPSFSTASVSANLTPHLPFAAPQPFAHAAPVELEHSVSAKLAELVIPTVCQSSAPTALAARHSRLLSITLFMYPPLLASLRSMRS